MIISDIVTTKKNSAEEKKVIIETLSKSTTSKPYRPLEKDIFDERRNSKKTIWLWLFIMVILIGGGVYIWHIYASATVTIRTIQAPYAFTKTPFTAIRSSGNNESEGTPFEIMVIEDVYKQTITYGTKNLATKKSRGTILVQNSASAKKITLKKGSVAVGSNNMHYTVLNGATIPGYTKKGTVITPGTTEVVIEAEKNGAEYDIAGSTYTFPSYSSKSTLLTAKTLGMGIVGGANGNMYTMTDDEANAITKDIQESAKNKIFIKANAEIPPGYRIYKNAVVYKADPISSIKESPTAVRDISQNTTLTAYLFRDRDIEKYIFTHSEHSLQEPSYSVSGIDQSDIALTTIPTDPKNATNLSLLFTGNGIITWSVDLKELQKSLLGVHKDSVDTIFTGFKTIDSATVTTNPWFERNIPLDLERIRMDIRN